MYGKTSYYQLEDWIDLMPSYVGPNAPVSKEYCDSMYRFLTITGDSLASYVSKKKMAQYDIQGARRITRFDNHMLNLDGRMGQQTRRAADIDPQTGIDKTILNLDHYYVQVLYELGSYANDYTLLKDELEALHGKGVIEYLNNSDLMFNENGYNTVAQYIGLNTTTPPYKPFDPIEPQVKEFVKTTKAKIVFVYGGLDPWTEAGIKDEDIPATQTNIARFVVPGGTHTHYLLAPDYSWEPDFGQKIINKVKEMLGTPTAIQSVQTEATSGRHTDVIYNLSGQQVGDSYRGIVIKNGRKVMQ